MQCLTKSLRSRSACSISRLREGHINFFINECHRDRSSKQTSLCVSLSLLIVQVPVFARFCNSLNYVKLCLLRAGIIHSNFIILGHGYFTAPEGDPSIVLRLKEDQDGAEPSANSVSSLNLLRLSAYTGLLFSFENFALFSSTYELNSFQQATKATKKRLGKLSNIIRRL